MRKEIVQENGNDWDYASCPSADDLFFRDLRNEVLEIPTIEQERELFGAIKAKRLEYSQSINGNKQSILDELNELRVSAAKYYLRLVVKIAGSYSRRTGLSIGELTDAGCIGLMNAIDQYDLNYYGEGKEPPRFSTYASKWINKTVSQGAARIFYGEDPKTVTLRNKILEAEDCLTQELEKSPTDKQIADYLGNDVDDVVLVRKDLGAMFSLDNTFKTAEGKDEDSDFSFGSWLSDERVVNSLSSVPFVADVKSCMSSLTAKERKAFDLKHGLSDPDGYERTMIDVGLEMGVSTSRAGVLVLVSSAKVKEEMEKIGY